MNKTAIQYMNKKTSTISWTVDTRIRDYLNNADMCDTLGDGRQMLEAWMLARIADGTLDRILRPYKKPHTGDE